MSVKNYELKMNLKICLLLAALLLLTDIWASFFLPRADWRINTAIIALQCLFILPLVYYAKDILNNGKKALFSGIPSMEGLAFAAMATGFTGSLAVGINALQGGLSLAGLLFAPMGLMLVMFLYVVYCQKQSGFNNNQKLAAADSALNKTAAFVLPAVFALALAAALSCWFYGLGAAAAWQVLGSVLLAAGAGVFVLADVLPQYFAIAKAKKEGYSFKDNISAINAGQVTMAVFEETFAQGGGKEITDVIGIGISEARLLALAAAVTDAAKGEFAELFKIQAAGMELPLCSGVIKMHGGISAQCKGKNIRIGQLDFVSSVADVPKKFAAMQQEFAAQGKKAFFVTGGRQLLGIIAVGEKINSSLTPILEELQKAGVRTVMFSSGSKQLAEYIGSKAGFTKTVAELSEEHQRELTDAFCRTGEVVALLKPGAGCVEVILHGNTAEQCGALFLENGNLRNLMQAIKLSERLQKIRRQNNKLALGMGGLWVLTASCVWLLLFKTMLPGAVLALIMLFSGIIIWLNSRRL